jgi:molybdopterin molybdotransferase
MISVNEAKKIIRAHTIQGAIQTIDLAGSSGYVLAEDMISPIHFPSFRQSAMDGYAFRFDDWAQQNVLTVEQELQAGDTKSIQSLKKGEAIRIFTGAKVPDDADTVVMQEHVERNGIHLNIKNPHLLKHANIRAVASQTTKGACILKQGSLITPGAAALLAGLGIHRLPVYTKPRCSILTTGKELVAPGHELQEGQIYESNSFALQNALQQMQISLDEICWVDDKREAIETAIQNALLKTDVLLITGGVSVGDYDFVSEALEKNGAEKLFHTVKQKPGKPLYVGKKQNKMIFGLPGNPGSVLTCFYEYVLPCLRQMMGYENGELLSLKLPLLDPISKKAGLTHFVKACIQSNGVAILDHQESYKMNAFAQADCLVMLDEETSDVQAGTLVNVHLLNY